MQKDLVVKKIIRSFALVIKKVTRIITTNIRLFDFLLIYNFLLKWEKQMKTHSLISLTRSCIN